VLRKAQICDKPHIGIFEVLIHGKCPGVEVGDGGNSALDGVYFSISPRCRRICIRGPKIVEQLI